jgi:branched-chain amino acid transport system ATP-binding protein
VTPLAAAAGRRPRDGLAARGSDNEHNLAEQSMAAIIDVQHVNKAFGGLKVINDCSIQVEEGSITGLIGPNGAGKSTLFNIIAGALPLDSGRVRLDGEDITNRPANELFHKGLLRTFQIAHEFSQMTALENLMMVPPNQPGESLFNAWFKPSLVGMQETEVRRRALEVVDFIGLNHVRNELAGNLSGGHKKLLELGRTMMTDARVVLLDEIAAGVNRTLLGDLVNNIERLNREMGYTFLVIEHDMDMIARLCDPVIVLAQGSVMVEGSIEDIQNNPEVIEAYFGTA